jgi:EAL domain-containing protein (putative c-di-GMP-specific phosphodiesterase class I)
MKLTVTAEGVESLEQIKILLNMHCTHFQGFLFGKPLKRDELSAFLIQETIPKPDAMEFSETRKTA